MDGNEKVLKLAETLARNEFPDLKYHKKCHNKFVKNTHKKKEVQSSCRSRIRGSRDISGILANVCIFCNADKYLPKQSTREKLLLCCQLRADATICKAAETKSDSIILAITADDIVAKEASYHPSCYRNYTKVCYREESRGIKGLKLKYIVISMKLSKV